ncbi:MAG TPA: hypothetical protein VMM12_18285 [Longimicrobiales bacterium]|nr:hypothetical protein [Longimicrobiales bacterium]
MGRRWQRLRARPARFAFALLAGGGAGTIVAAPAPVAAQDEGWNGGRALELVARARDRRQEPVTDSLLRSYRADATGHIYFFLVREQAGEPVLLRADQVALELYWREPGHTKQVIRGMRSEEQFPIKDFAYYLDRYTVIQNGFGDEIRVGEGRDVADVPHPLAPAAEAVYDYRLADSMTLRLPGRAEPLRVYEVQVRPRDFGRPAIVGSLFLERARADLVRLAFTFTPSAYLDRRNERVEVALENALWEGRYWLPREQRLVVRREIPELDLDVGTVIRAAIRVTDYELNPDIPRGFFDGNPVIMAAGPAGLAAYDFEEGLFEGLENAGLAPGTNPGTLDAVDVEEIAGRILRQRFLRGIPRLRFYAPNASAILRFDRAEGLVTGAGLAYGLGNYQLTAYAGRAWGAETATAELAARPLPGAGLGWLGEAYYNRPVDLGVRPAAAGVLASGAAAFGDDFRDLYFERGIALGRELLADGGRTLAIVATAESHVSPRLAVSTAPLDDDPFRPVIPIDDGDQLTLAVRGRSTGQGPLGERAQAGFTLETGWFEPAGAANGRWFTVASIDALRTWRGADLGWGVDLRQTLRFTFEGARQHGALLGGRNTLPGHHFRAYYGTHIALADVEGWITVVPRWLRLRALAGAAWVLDESAHDFPASVGIGFGFVDGILRLDYNRGFGSTPNVFDTPGPAPPPPPGGVWILSVDPRLWPFL